MEVPGIVEAALDGEEVVDRVDLGGDDELYVTPTRSLLYRSEGLLSDESVERYDHEAEVLSISEGRRKTRITLTHPIEGTQEFTLPSAAAEAAIPPMLAGLLRANGVIDADEEVIDTFLFSELTLVVTADRLVKHIGEAIWDLEYEEYPYETVTGVSAEEGSVATQLVLAIDGGAERIKTPSDRAREVRECLEDAIRSYHDLRPGEDIATALGDAEADDGGEDAGDGSDAEDSEGGMDFGGGVDPLDAGDTRNIGEAPDLDEAPGAIGEDDAGADAETDASATAAGSAGAGAASDADASATAADEEGEAGTPEEDAAEPAGERQPTDAAGAGGGSESNAEDSGETAHAATDDSGSRSDDATQAETPSADESRADGAATAPGDGAEPAEAEDATHAESEEAEETAPATEDDPFEAAGFEPAEEGVEALAEEVAELRTAVQKQNTLLARQHKTIQQLVEELRRGR